MAVITHIEEQIPYEQYLNNYPKQMVSDKEKKSDRWIKNTMDYFESEALKQYFRNKETFVKNYNLVKGILKREDFFEEPEVKSLVDTILDGEELPAYVKHYPILNPPLNSMIGEMSKRPDNAKVKAVDSDSKNQELQFKTDILIQYATQIIQQINFAKAAQQGLDINSQEVIDQVNQLTAQKVQEEIENYTSTAEKWANKILDSCKIDFNVKELSEEGFSDLLKASREFHHIKEDNSELGFRLHCLNPKKVGGLHVQDKKYTKDWYATWVIDVMELSEILHEFDLDEEEITNLEDKVKENNLVTPKESNLYSGKTGLNSIDYNTYDPTVVRERMLAEADLMSDGPSIDDFLGTNSRTSTHGMKFTVLQCYWISKKKVGKLQFVNPQGQLQRIFVDETYKKIPTQISIEWTWENQWYQGIKIGSEVYKVRPFDLLPYSPIIGVVHDAKNVDEARSMVDLMKPLQTIYNICWNQIFRLLEKEIGNVFLGSLRHIPTAKDGDPQDSEEIWIMEALERGVLMVDDSPENLKAPSTFNQFKNIDLTRSAEIQSRVSLAVQVKLECWELVGFSQQRLGRVQATETATATQAGLDASYTQTEPYFVQHEYLMNQVYQAIIDTAQYVQSKNPLSTVSYITNEGENAFIQVTGSEIRLPDLKVFVTSRAEDQRFFQDMRNLAQPILQNGGTPYDVAILYSTNSVRQMKQIYKSLKDKNEQMMAQQQQLAEAQLQQQAQQFELQQQLQQNLEQQKMLHESYENQLDRLSNERIKAMELAAKAQTGITGNASTPTLDLNSIITQEANATTQYNLQLSKLQQDAQKLSTQLAIENEKIKIDKEKLQVEREKIASAERVAKQNKNKYDK